MEREIRKLKQVSLPDLLNASESYNINVIPGCVYCFYHLLKDVFQSLSKLKIFFAIQWLKNVFGDWLYTDIEAARAQVMDMYTLIDTFSEMKARRKQIV